jgi:hypothetical protein
MAQHGLYSNELEQNTHKLFIDDAAQCKVELWELTEEEYEAPWGAHDSALY